MKRARMLPNLAALLALVSLVGPPADAQDQPRSATGGTAALGEVAAGTHFLVGLEDTLGTKNSKSGDRFRVKTLEPLYAEDGTVLDSAPGMSGYNAGILPGMRVVEVNGTKFSLSGMEDSIRKSARGTIPELTIVNGASTSRRRLEYHEGAKYPLLVRDPSRPELLTKILAPHASLDPKVNGQ